MSSVLGLWWTHLVSSCLGWYRLSSSATYGKYTWPLSWSACTQGLGLSLVDVPLFWHLQYPEVTTANWGLLSQFYVAPFRISLQGIPPCHTRLHLRGSWEAWCKPLWPLTLVSSMSAKYDVSDAPKFCHHSHRGLSCLQGCPGEGVPWYLFCIREPLW